jgi:hypothetical protein
MMISDQMVVPHEAAADWLALSVSAIVYLIWSALVLLAYRRLAARSRAIAVTATVIFFALGIAGYVYLFIAIDTAAFAHVVAAIPSAKPLTPHLESLLATMSRQRAEDFVKAPYEFGVINCFRAGVGRAVALWLIPLAITAMIVAVVLRNESRSGGNGGPTGNPHHPPSPRNTP